MEVSGARDRLHDKVYDAIHLDKIDLNKEDVLFDWVAKQGIDRQNLLTLQFLLVQNQDVPRQRICRSYGLTGVPAVVVDGKYMTSGQNGRYTTRYHQTMEELIEKVRQGTDEEIERNKCCFTSRCPPS